MDAHVRQRKHALVNPHRDVSPDNQDSVVRCTVLDAIGALGPGSLLCVPAHLLGKSRESTQPAGLFTALSAQTVARKRQLAALGERIYVAIPNIVNF